MARFRRYLVPVDTDGVTASPNEEGHGRYTLTAGHTYVYMLPTDDSVFVSVDITGYTSAMVITSATVQDTNHAGTNTGGTADVTDISTTAGEWHSEKPSSGYVATDGTGWTVSTDVVAAAGTGVGGAMWHIAETGAHRTRLLVVVGGTGGIVRVSAAGK